jgi:YegS/Rv2252/BmrU family lipid kinase
LAIVNPVAGSGSAARLWPQVKSRLAEIGVTFDEAITNAPGHAVTLAAEGIAAGYDRLISVGGDGTLHEVANGIIAARGADGLAQEITLGIVPLGTGADFVRSLGTPRSWQSACTHLTGDKTRIIDVGEMTFTGRDGAPQRRYFVNVAGLGFDGEVASRVNSSASKRLGGTIPYVTNLVLTLINYSNKDVVLHMDDQDTPGRMNSIVMANGGWFGGGMYIAPNARPDDGFFDLIIIGDVGKLELLQTLPRVYNGTHLTHPKVKAARVRSMQVTSQQEMWIQADGELIGRAPVTFTIRPQALRLKV